MMAMLGMPQIPARTTYPRLASFAGLSAIWTFATTSIEISGGTLPDSSLERIREFWIAEKISIGEGAQEGLEGILVCLSEVHG